MKQTTRVLYYMQSHGSITQQQATADLGITRLAAVIHLLKKDGTEIESEMIPVKNRYNEICHVARYRLAKKGQQELFK